MRLAVAERSCAILVNFVKTPRHASRELIAEPKSRLCQLLHKGQIDVMSIAFQNVYDQILIESNAFGGSHLSIFSGYASSTFAYHVLHDKRLSHASVDLIIGMAATGAIPIWDHIEYKRLVTEGRFSCKYYVGPPASHSKLYLWSDVDSTPVKAFVGSCNFSWGGFRHLTETAVEASAPSVLQLFPAKDASLIDCNSPTVAELVPFTYARKTREQKIDIATVESQIVDNLFVDLPLTMRNGEIQNKGGLNWGQREERRNKDEAYLKIPASVNQESPDFFPPRGEHFTMITDDGRSFVCVVAQGSSKAIHTPRNNADFGTYFRQRLSVPSQAFVNTEALNRYGRNTVRIFKIAPGTYYLDFKP